MTDLKFERYFFDIAIYRTAPNFFYAERDENVQKQLDWIEQHGGVEREKYPDIYKRQEERLTEQYDSWPYNEVIGWLRLYVLGDQIRGETWFIDAKQIRRNLAKKRFRHYGKAFELSFFPGEDSSADIYNQICVTIEELHKEKSFKGRYVDLEEFHNIGPFINWRGLIGLDK
jgi:hypothetical protein